MRLSYIIPYYNGESTIFRCLDSIYQIGLSLDEFEVIVVDDCSPNSAESFLKPYCENKPNLKVFRHSENKRQGGAKNTGISKANGEYIAFADQDDVVVSQGVSKVLLQLADSSIDVVACRYNQQSSNHTLTEHGINVLYDGQVLPGKDYCENYYDFQESNCPWRYLYNREYLLSQNYPMEECVLMEDADWIEWHLVHAKSVVSFSETIYTWLYNSTSITKTISPKHLAAWVLIGFRKILVSQEIESISKDFSIRVYEDGRWNVIKSVHNVWKIKKAQPFYNDIKPVISQLLTLQLDRWTRFFLSNPCWGSSIVCLMLPLRVFRNVLRGLRRSVNDMAL